jgi:hypothetical protein
LVEKQIGDQAKARGISIDAAVLDVLLAKQATKSSSPSRSLRRWSCFCVAISLPLLSAQRSPSMEVGRLNESVLNASVELGRNRALETLVIGTTNGKHVKASRRRDGPNASAEPAASGPGQIVLVLQGGGWLGAYQAGVYQALHETGIEPDWIIGTSIGAINANLIAGNESQDRARCRVGLGRLDQKPGYQHPERPAIGNNLANFRSWSSK